MRKNLLKLVTLSTLMATLIAGLTMTKVGMSSPGPVVSVDPPISSAAPGDLLNINVSVRDIVPFESLLAWTANMSFDPSILHVLEETNTTNNDVANGTVWVKNYPLARFSISPDPPYNKSQELTHDASTSTSSAGVLVDPDSYNWDFEGDGVFDATGMVVNHTYAWTGGGTHRNYTVTLNVTDTEGLWDIATKNITIWKTTPESSAASSSTEVLAGETDTADNISADSVVTASESSSSYVNVRDIIITNIVFDPDTVYAFNNETISINVTVQNNPQGYRRESFILFAYAWPSTIGNASGSLNPGESQTFNFFWNTTSRTTGRNYTIKAVVPPLYGVDEGPFLVDVVGVGNTTEILGLYDADNYLGRVTFGWTLFPYRITGGVGAGTLATVIFEVMGEGVSPLQFDQTELFYYDGHWPKPIAHTSEDGIFTILGDMDGNGGIDSYDLYILSVAYTTSVGEPRYNWLADLDRDDDVDSNDLNLFAAKYGTYYGS